MMIVLPLPHKHLSPNSRCHWRSKAQATAKMRYWSNMAAVAAMREDENKNAAASMPWSEVTARATFYRRTRGRIDKDNALSSLKSAFDGFTDAGVWADDSGVTHLPVVIAYDTADPRVEIEVLEIVT